MIVVVTFMLGLGIGSLLVGRFAMQLRRPLWILACLEVLLALANLAIALALSRDLADSIYGMQRVAVGIGLPLRAVYGLTSITVLLVPCVAMGMTIPVAAEAVQRQLRATTTRTLGRLVLMNTLGSAAGGFLAGFYLLAYVGQFRSLFVAIAANTLAAVLIAIVAIRVSEDGVAAGRPLTFRKGQLTRDEILGGLLGVFSLAYEMYLFRAVALQFGPLPIHFAVVVVAFLLSWSFGFWIAQLFPIAVGWSLLATATAVCLVPFVDAPFAFVPCVLFGTSFGCVLRRTSHAWGRDVGRFYALNTAGCVVGTLLATFVGYEWTPSTMLLAIAVGYVLAFAFLEPAPAGLARIACAAAVAVVILGLPDSHTAVGGNVARVYFGRDGVVQVERDGNVRLDGLSHSRLSRQDDHVGTNNWFMAALPFLAHRGPIERALVVGVGTGITTVTLARSTAVGHVDGYEVNRTLARVYRDFPNETLQVARDPKISLHWQDGRSGLALRNVDYDLITSAPLVLRQAGSSILLSREYFALVRRRLRPGGVFAVYANAFGNQTQALAVRQTLAGVFPAVESFGDGYLLLASDAPIHMDLALLEAPDCLDRFCAELRQVGAGALGAMLDRPRLAWTGAVPILDDHPVVEYPDALEALSSRD
jgi:spermidine synthase